MPLKISPKLASISPSLTLALDERVRELTAAGRSIINLTVGQPDFNTPEWICRAAAAAIEAGATRYTSPMGTPDLREAAARWLSERSGPGYAPDQVIACSGSKHAIYNALQALVQPGDEVLVPAPYWVSYPDLVRMAGGVPVHPDMPLESGFKLTPEALAGAITPKTRVAILNAPSNPTGAVYTRAEAEALARLLVEHDVAVISDEIYDRILFDDTVHVPFASLPDMEERTITVNGVSKSYAMTGWRIGFAAGPAPVIKAMGRYQAQATGNPCSVSQAAALAAIRGNGPELKAMTDAYARRRRLVMNLLEGVERLEWTPPSGAFYFFIRASRCFGLALDGRKIGNIEDLVAAFIDGGVGVVPGTGFGAPKSFRLSFAASDDEIEKGVSIIRDIVNRLK